MFQVIYLILATGIAVAPLIIVALMLRGLTMMFLRIPETNDDEDDKHEDHNEKDNEKDEDEQDDDLDLPSTFNI